MNQDVNEKGCVAAKELRSEFLNRAAQGFNQRSLRQIARALAVAERAHAAQTRDDGAPYILHPLRVAISLMRELDIYDTELLCAALLHDVVEDNERLTPDHIETDFSFRISSIVRTLTRPSEPAKTREQINHVYFQRLEHSDEDCKLVKLADKLDNVRDAVNCTDPDKQQRTVTEARDFYLSLAASLRDAKRQQIILRLMKKAIAMTETSENPKTANSMGSTSPQDAPHG